MLSYTFTLEEVIENFNVFENWEDRYRYIIELGEELPNLPDEYKVDANKVHGCLSQVWFICHKNGDNLITYTFQADSDAKIIRGLIAIILIIFNNKTKEEIKLISLENIFNKLDLQQHLSLNRRNGFISMINRVYDLVKD